MKIETIISEIEKALQNKCFLSALALTLVLPDICGQYDYPEIYNRKDDYNGHRGQGGAYAKWYDNNIRKNNVDPEALIDLMDGWSCWKLRCQFLHNGSIDLDDVMSSEEKRVHFKLISSEFSNSETTLGGYSAIFYDEEKKNCTINLDIVNFCEVILEELKHSYLNNKRFIEETDSASLNYIEINIMSR